MSNEDLENEDNWTNEVAFPINVMSHLRSIPLNELGQEIAHKLNEIFNEKNINVSIVTNNAKMSHINS